MSIKYKQRKRFKDMKLIRKNLFYDFKCESISFIEENNDLYLKRKKEILQ
jgi:hypothetical protein